MVIENGLKWVFLKVNIDVYYDLFGVVCVICGNFFGILCIIGMGFNICLYDGKDVIDNVINLGYFCGDEGSGIYLGKKFICYYFYCEFLEELEKKLEVFIGGGR